MRNKLKWLIGLTLGFAIANCGRLKPSDTPSANSADKNTKTIPAEEVKLELTAEYEAKPVDLVIVRENNSYLFNDTNYPFRDRFFRPANAAETAPLAFKNLAMRLANSGLDLQFGVMDMIFNSADLATKAGDLVVQSGDKPILTRDSTFHTVAYDRLRYFPNPFRAHPVTPSPMFVIKQFLQKANLTAGPSSGMNRADALLAFLFVGLSNEANEGTEAADVIELLDKERGPGNWIVSAIVPDKGGCEFSGNTQVAKGHSSMFNGITDSSLWPSYVRLNKIIKLQEHSKGIFHSICENSHIDFTDRFVSEGTQAAFFEVKLKKPADPKTLTISVNDSPVEGWVYKEANSLLLVPTTIKSGTKFVVAYKTPEIEVGEVTYGPDGKKDGVSKVPEKAQNPALIAFTADGVQDALQRGGCQNCHGGQNFASFDDAYDKRADILNRIKLPEADPLHMPRMQPSIPAADIATIEKWVNDFP